jgi:hypothetical protein
MLTCSGCLVVRFCSADHQKMASKKAALGGSLRMGRHKDICGVLRTIKETSCAGPHDNGSMALVFKGSK